MSINIDSAIARRSFLKVVGISVAALAGFARAVQTLTPPNKWVLPPGKETLGESALIDEAEKALGAGGSCSSVLTDARYMPAHAFPRFRAALKTHATTAPLSICTADEPGEKSFVRLLIEDGAGKPIPDALIYFYHTSAKGWYSDRGYHVQANSGDEKHARLFGYVRTNRNGFAEIKTIRPAGYPDGNLPAHYHVEVLEPGVRVTEIQFSDDPRLTAEARVRSANQQFVITDPDKGSEGLWRIRATIRVLPT